MQVLSDLPGVGTVDAATASSSERLALKTWSALELQKQLVEELNDSQQARLDAASQVIGTTSERRANREYIQALDHCLQQSLGYGLSQFIPSHACTPLSSGERRYRLTDDATGDKTPCRKMANGSKTYELIPRKDVARPVLHLSIDQGSHGFSGCMWLLLGENVRMTVVSDPYHRICNDMQAAMTQSGLQGVRLDALEVMRLRRGPFGSHSNLGKLREAAKELKSATDRGSLLWDLLYEPIMLSRGSQMSEPGFGTEEHISKSFDMVISELAIQTAGTPVKLSRWWAFEQRTRTCSKKRFEDWLWALANLVGDFGLVDC